MLEYGSAKVLYKSCSTNGVANAKNSSKMGSVEQWNPILVDNCLDFAFSICLRKLEKSVFLKKNCSVLKNRLPGASTGQKK